MQQDMEQRFFELYNTQSDAIFRHCYYRLSDRELARDTVQETFTRTWEYIMGGKTPENLRAFLYRVANNLIIDHYRKKKTYSLESLTESYGFDPSVDKTDEIINTADAKRVLEYIPQLPDAYRAVFVMRYIDDMTPTEIAAVTNETENAVSVRIHRAAKKLHEYIKEQNGHEA